MARRDKVVLIVGGAGSIGSALAQRLCYASCEDLLLLDREENRLEETRQRLEEKGFHPICYVGDVRNFIHLSSIVKRHKPDIILNCAASKHVVSGQYNVSETTRNNLLTTLNLLKVRPRDSKFVHISTDKAVEPTSVMGASKMLCESMIRSEFPSNQDNRIIRFGNVMRTNGSVLDIWERQFREGVPLRVTDLKMKRWLLPIEDACDQILRVLGFEPGTYLLDMGRMCSVGEMLGDFLTSKANEDYPINFVGAKAGEKIEEKLLWDCEVKDEIKAGGRTIIRVSESPKFSYEPSLRVSASYNDVLTLKLLRKQFKELVA